MTEATPENSRNPNENYSFHTFGKLPKPKALPAFIHAVWFCLVSTFRILEVLNMLKWFTAVRFVLGISLPTPFLHLIMTLKTASKIYAV